MMEDWPPERQNVDTTKAPNDTVALVRDKRPSIHFSLGVVFVTVVGTIQITRHRAVNIYLTTSTIDYPRKATSVDNKRETK